MSDIRNGIGAVWLLCAAIMACPATAVADTTELRQQIRMACPAAWEDLYSVIEFQPGDDIWQNNLSDKAQFVQFANDYLMDEDGQFDVGSYGDAQGIIYFCGGLRYTLYEALHEDAVETRDAFDALTLIDTDNDGVNDALDACPDTVESGVDIAGCSYSQQDEDGDGVPNGDDQCLGTPAGQPIAGDGCTDTDLDGTADHADPYPLQNPMMCPGT